MEKVSFADLIPIRDGLARLGWDGVEYLQNYFAGTAPAPLRFESGLYLSQNDIVECTARARAEARIAQARAKYEAR